MTSDQINNLLATLATLNTQYLLFHHILNLSQNPISPTDVTRQLNIQHDQIIILEKLVRNLLAENTKP